MWILRKVTWLQLTVYYIIFEGGRQVTGVCRGAKERLRKATSGEGALLA